MKIDEKIRCPICEGVYFQVKREATYLYTYNIETPLTSNWSNEEDEDEVLPFLFDNRELKSSIEYAECKNCKTRFLWDSDNNNSKIHFTIVQKAIRSDLVAEPEFYG